MAYFCRGGAKRPKTGVLGLGATYDLDLRTKVDSNSTKLISYLVERLRQVGFVSRNLIL